MKKTRRVTAIVPEDLLQAAQEVTGTGITETIVEGLEEIRKRHFYEKLRQLEGKTDPDGDRRR